MRIDYDYSGFYGPPAPMPSWGCLMVLLGSAGLVLGLYLLARFF